MTDGTLKNSTRLIRIVKEGAKHVLYSRNSGNEVCATSLEEFDENDAAKSNRCFLVLLGFLCQRRFLALHAWLCSNGYQEYGNIRGPGKGRALECLRKVIDRWCLYPVKCDKLETVVAELAELPDTADEDYVEKVISAINDFEEVHRETPVLSDVATQTDVFETFDLSQLSAAMRAPDRFPHNMTGTVPSTEPDPLSSLWKDFPSNPTSAGAVNFVGSVAPPAAGDHIMVAGHSDEDGIPKMAAHQTDEDGVAKMGTTTQKFTEQWWPRALAAAQNALYQAEAARNDAVAVRDNAVAARDNALTARKDAQTQAAAFAVVAANRDAACAQAISERDDALAQVAARDTTLAQAVAERHDALAERDAAVTALDTTVAQMRNVAAERDAVQATSARECGEVRARLEEMAREIGINQQKRVESKSRIRRYKRRCARLKAQRAEEQQPLLAHGGRGANGDNSASPSATPSPPRDPDRAVDDARSNPPDAIDMALTGLDHVCKERPQCPKCTCEKTFEVVRTVALAGVLLALLMAMTALANTQSFKFVALSAIAGTGAVPRLRQLQVPQTLMTVVGLTVLQSIVYDWEDNSTLSTGEDEAQKKLAQDMEEKREFELVNLWLGVGSGIFLTATVVACWIHHCCSSGRSSSVAAAPQEEVLELPDLPTVLGQTGTASHGDYVSQCDCASQGDDSV